MQIEHSSLEESNECGLKDATYPTSPPEGFLPAASHYRPISSHQRASGLLCSGLEQLVLKGHVRLGLKTDTGTEDVRQGPTLLSQGIHYRGPRWSQGRLHASVSYTV